MTAATPIELTVNGVPRRVGIPPASRLVDVLRDALGLTGTKEGCGEGACGACSVLIDGVLSLSCLVPVAQCHGASIVTIEGLAPAELRRLAPVQRALLEAGGVQCGFCTPGVVLAAHALLQARSRPTLEEIRRALAGNLCRCTGYTAICEAVARAATEP